MDAEHSQKLHTGQPSSLTLKPDNTDTVKPVHKLEKKSIPSYYRPTIAPGAINICHLPDELLLAIFESFLILTKPVSPRVKRSHLHQNQIPTLASICRTCTTFYRIAVSMLYKTPIPYNSLFRTLVHRPDLAEHVKAIDLGIWDHALPHPYLPIPFEYSDANQNLKVIIHYLTTIDEWAWELLGQPWRKSCVRNLATQVLSAHAMFKIEYLISSYHPKMSLACLLAAAILLNASNPSPERCLFPNLQSISISCATLGLFPMILTSLTLKTLRVHSWDLRNPTSLPWRHGTSLPPSGTSGIENLIISNYTSHDKLLARLIACCAKLLTFEMTVEAPDPELAYSDVWADTRGSLFPHRQSLRRIVLHCPRLSELKRRELKGAPRMRKPFGSCRLREFITLEHLEIQHPVLTGPNIMLGYNGLTLPSILPPSLRNLVISDVVNGVFGHLKLLEMDKSKSCPMLRSLEIRTVYSHDTLGRSGPAPQFWLERQLIEVMDQEKLRQRFMGQGVDFFWSQPGQKPLKPRLRSILLWRMAKKNCLDVRCGQLGCVALKCQLNM